MLQFCPAHICIHVPNRVMEDAGVGHPYKWEPSYLAETVGPSKTEVSERKFEISVPAVAFNAGHCVIKLRTW
jgi:hypothetical protein